MRSIGMACCEKSWTRWKRRRIERSEKADLADRQPPKSHQHPPQITGGEFVVHQDPSQSERIHSARVQTTLASNGTGEAGLMHEVTDFRVLVAVRIREDRGRFAEDG